MTVLTNEERFRRCLREVLRHEGGYVDHPKDPGGATNLGVTLATLSEALGRLATKAEVRALTPDAVSPIYEMRYWRAAGCDRLPAGLDLMVFDLAVNSGPARARTFLQRAAGVYPDGEIGPVTVASIAATSPVELINRLSNAREDFYRSLSTFPTFGKGWLRRLEAVEAQALAWVPRDGSTDTQLASTTNFGADATRSAIA